MIDRTVMRGLSDAYGSWKTICILPRSARSSRAAAASSTLLAAEPHRARRRLEQAAGSSRPVVRLAAARLPHQPERLARARPRSSRPRPPCTVADARCGSSPRGSGTPSRGRSPRAPGPSRVGATAVAASRGRRLRASLAASSSVVGEVARRRVLARRPSCSSGRVGHAHARRARRTGTADGTRSPAAGTISDGGCPSMRCSRSSLGAPVEPRQRRRAARACTGGCGS